MFGELKRVNNVASSLSRLKIIIAFEVRTQTVICVGCFVHYLVPCAINKGGFFKIAFLVVVDTHLPRFEALAYLLPHFDELTHVVIRASSSVC